MRQCTHCGSRFSNDARFCPHDGEPTTPAAPLRADSYIGKLIAGRYRIESILGEGGMGVVYRAVHIELDKTVAIKMLRSDMAHDEIVPKRFVQEAKALSRIQHPHVVEVFDFGRAHEDGRASSYTGKEAGEQGTAYFVMEYLEGRSLRDAIRSNDLSTAEILRIARAIAEGLAAAHEAGVIHRDLKPENIQLITRDDDLCFVKILDFGVAKVAGVSKLTRNGAVFGTPHYMSPEQAQGLTVDHRSDIYSYGIILYELFTGRLPFDADSFVRVISQQIFDPPPPLKFEPERAALGPFAPIVLACLEKKITDRYRSFEAVIEALDELERKSARAIWTKPRILIPAAAALLIAAIGVVFFITRSSTEVPPPTAVSSLAAPSSISLGDASTFASLSEAIEAIDDAFEDDAPLDELEAAPSFVLIDSDPQGAFVSLDGIGIGATPIQIPRPLSGERRLRIERDGRMAQEFLLGSSGPERLVVHLPDQRAQPARPSVPSQSSARTASAMTTTTASHSPSNKTSTPAPTPSSMKTNRSPAPSALSDVVDPWGD